MRQTMSYVYRDEDKGWHVECDVTADVVEYRPAVFSSPAEGGYLEDVCFEVLSFKLDINGHSVDVGLTPELKEALAIHVNDSYEGDTDFQARLGNKFLD